MVIARTLAWGLGLALLLTACPGYSPEFVDCKVKCSPKGACPAGRECKGGLCRPPNVTTNCDCTPGTQRPCGGGLGLCTPGVQSCTNAGSWGSCLGEGKPTSEICDDKDNDCNGTVDEDVVDAQPCPMSKGVCASTVQKCVAGIYSGTCAPADYGASYEPLETKCDGLDNDCNGLVDATAPVQLMTEVSEFVLAEYDGGFSIVAVEEPATGGYQVVLLRLTDALAKRGALVPVSPPALPGTLNVAARTVPGGTTFVAWAHRAVDAGVNLSAVDSNGIVSQFPSYPASEKTGELSLGVNASKVLVSWPAHFSTAARLVSWDLVDGGVSARDFGRFADGGFNEQNEVYAARLSHTGKVIGVRGYDNDGGNSTNLTVELQGTRTSTAGLGSRFKFVEVGNLVQAGWTHSSPGFPLFFISPSSGVEFRNDLFSGTTTSLKYQQDQNITPGSIGRGINSSVIVWTERNSTAVLATPFGNGSQARQRALFGDGGYFGDVQVAHPGGQSQLIGIVWRDTLFGPGTVSGMMICQP